MGRWVKASSSNVIRFYEQDTAPTNLEGITLGDLWVDTSGTPALKICTSLSPITYAAVGGGGGSAAPTDAQYVVLASNGTLTNESVLAVGSNKLTLSGATLDIDTANLSTALSLSSYVPYTGASSSVNLGTNGLTVHNIKGDASDGLLLEASNGTDIGIFGTGNTANVTWYGNHNFNTVTGSRIAVFGASKTLQSGSVGSGLELTAGTLDISSSYTGQTSITTLGTISSGTWNGTAIQNSYLANSSITINSTSVSLGGTINTIGLSYKITQGYY